MAAQKSSVRGVPEFTGERIVPGQVELDLWNEHFSRYAFAVELARLRGGSLLALDLGCGAGYGSAELARVCARVTGCDVAQDAVDYARNTYQLPNLQFVEAGCENTGFDDASFDLITAFEVIEHLHDFRAMLRESKRLLKPGGILMVSTPNRLYYADARAESGPNPFHTHEFEFDEFRDELARVFPAVNVLLQNRLEAFSFQPARAFPPAGVRIDASGTADTAHFFLAICGDSLESPAFVYIPSAANLLREREQHIRTLRAEVELKDTWLEETRGQRDGLQEQFNKLERHLEEQNRWAQQLETELTASRERVVSLQRELEQEQDLGRETAAAYESKVAALERENTEKTEWARHTEERLSTELSTKMDELAETVRLLDRAESTVEERTRWAQSLDAEINSLRGILQAFQKSKWVKAGRRLGLAPRVAGKAGENS